MTIDLNNIAPNLKRVSDNGFIYYQVMKRNLTTFHQTFDDVKKVLELFDQHNINKGDYIILGGENTYDWVVHDLACIYRGVISVPAGEYTMEQIESMLGGVTIKYCIGENKNTSLKNKINSDEYKKYQGLQNPEPCYYSPNDVFTVIFTSGTSGTPKAIAVRKKSFDLLCGNGVKDFTINQKDKLIAFLPFAVYLQRVYIYAAVLLNINIVLTSISFVFPLLKAEKPTLFIAIPHLYDTVQAMFLKQVKNKRFGYLLFSFFNFLVSTSLIPKNPLFANIWGNKIRCMMSGSAPLKSETLLFYQKTGHPIYQAYGMNEIGIISANYPGANRPGSVGKVCANLKASVSDSGEIIVESDYLTNTSYITGTFNTYVSETVVNTGDLGHIDKDGFIYITGRNSNKIILNNGKKVIPEAEEQKIEAIESVRNSLLFSRNNTSLGLVVSIENQSAKNTVLNKIQALQHKSILPKEISEIEFLYENFSVENRYLNKSLKKNRNTRIKQETNG